MTGEEKAIYNPATGGVVAYQKRHSIDDFKAMACDAAAAQVSWEKIPVKERAAFINRIPFIISENADNIVRIISECTGKTRIEAMSAEVIPCAIAARYYARNAKRFLERYRIANSSILFFNKKSTLYREPYGVIGIISPWNYPFSIPLNEAMTGLLCGNAVILKVATQAQPVGECLSEIIEKTGLPRHLFQLVHLSGEDAGAAFTGGMVQKIFFTGSTAVGKKLMALAAQQLIPLCLELGGKDPMIVLKDADMLRAARCAVWAGISNSGQSCGGVERIYVEGSVYDSFMDLLKKEVTDLRQGVDADHSVDFGSLTVKEQLETVKTHLDDALAKGALISAQSENLTSGSGLFFPAIVLENVTDDMLVMNEETFGPILAVVKVKDAEEAVVRANDSLFGLTSSVWTRKKQLSYRIAQKLKTGTVTLNDHLMSHGMSETPWGGYRESGQGRSHGRLCFEEMTRPKVIVEERLPSMPKNIWWPPYSKRLYNDLRRIFDFLYAGNIFRKIGGMFTVVKLFLRSFRR